MSTSRLEKFIYAICSMEVSDLPTPLSRIEILWNCLITGEIPDFEPQSRNEQYLMAMLGLYELDQLPTPMNRGEKLLYKIAMGETDLSDIPTYLSRYEELLGYLAENGGVGDFEYILQTLNQRLNTLYSTKERPVKSAILKGSTLVNLDGGTLYLKTDVSSNITEVINIPFTQKLKTDTKYLIIFNVLENNLVSTSNMLEFRDEDTGSQNIINIGTSTGIIKTIITPSINANRFRFRCQGYTSGNKISINNFMIIEYQDGMENWNIPYFTGMQSVKLPVLTTTGKNLCDNSKNKLAEINSNTGLEYIETNKSHIVSDYIKIESSNVIGSVYQNGSTPTNPVTYRIYDNNKNYLGTNINMIANGGYIRLRSLALSGSYSNANDVLFQLEQGSIATTYEPYKTNILSVSEDVELRGIGDVRDTLDCLTGEVTERIGEIVLDGSEDWILDGYSLNISGINDNLCFFTRDINNTYLGGAYWDNAGGILSSKLSTYGYNYLTGAKENYQGISIADGRIAISIDKDLLSSHDSIGLKEWLQSNPITIQYQLETESVKTVDLTTVDQDGQPTQLKTFNDITCVELSSEGLIPEVELEVATKISETLSTMGLQHHELSETQNKLGQTIDEQTENTDATMMATTEIYENL